MGISQNHAVDTFLLPPSTTLIEIQGYAESIGAAIEYQNQRIYLRTHNGRRINIIITNGRPRLH